MVIGCTSILCTIWPPSQQRACLNYDFALHIADIKYLHPDRADPTFKEIRANFTLLERAVAQFDARFTLRALRSISSLRKKLTDRVICSVIVLTYAPTNPTARVLIEALDMEGEAIQAVVAQYKEEIQQMKGNAKELKEPIPEIDVYIAILIQVGAPCLPDVLLPLITV